MSVQVNTTTNNVTAQNVHQTIRIVDNNAANIIDVTQPITNVIQVATPGPQGERGPSIPFTNIGNDVYLTTSSLETSNVGITGSLKVTGSLYMNNNKQFNYGAFSDTTDQTLAAGVSGSFTYNTVDIIDGVTLVNNRRLTVPSTGIYNFQFSAQLLANSNNTIVYIWIKKNGINIPNSATQVFLRNNEASVAAWNWVIPMNANEYAELAWQSNNGQASIEHFDANGQVPAVPSVIVTVTQVA